MKKNFPVTGNEHGYADDLQIISTTDRKGIIRYVNDAFCQISGFNEDELLGHNHNIIRHPHMPPAAFQDLWDTVKQGRAWMGIVNNRCRNGDHYWVDAYVTPIYEGDQVTGYQSVRVKPARELVERAEALYQGINDGFPLWRKLTRVFSFGMTGRLMAGFGLVLGFMVLTGWLAGVDWSAGLLGMLATGVLGGGIMAWLLARPWKQAAERARTVIDNALATEVYSGRRDELGVLLTALHAQESRLRTVLTRMSDAASHVNEVADRAVAIVDRTDAGVRQQQSEIDQVASAMHEMSATVQEIARNAASTADATREADREADRLSGTVEQVAGRIRGLAGEVHQAAEVVRRLEDGSARIGDVVDVIRSIAEQTNLLALNAAIEAARAGESGRGFAVVADEVRTLATRTQESTQEIQRVIEELQKSAVEAARTMDQGEQSAQDSVAEVTATLGSLKTINEAIGRISDMSVQIATASEEQSAVAEEINRNVVNISQVADDTASASRETHQASGELSGLVRNMQSMVTQFGD